ncbi:MAG: tRNA uridine-5-carboxymethylaminomethyl(34) synthesis GTPase MnmE, partial [Bacteroidetes bacterium]|nr:tRNA uridine-5-carboxymethylaminomethyl(34) synthesis GTPase MnmE [Bacteroidota bacterium]
NAPVLIIANKADLINEQNTTLKSHFQHLKNLTFLSAKNNIDIEKAKESIYDLALENYHFNSENVIISNNRHYEALKNAETAIVVILEQLDLGISTDFIAQDIKTALRYLGDITGNIDVDRDILGTIFSKFCIGK